MDHFGIGQGVVGAAKIYFLSSRRTGRTVSLIESLKTGDRVYFADRREADRVKRLCKDRGVDVETLVVDPRTPRDIFDYGSVSGEGRAIFDHGWVEEFYLAAIERARNEIDYLQRETSGYGEPHRETRRKAEELARWRV